MTDVEMREGLALGELTVVSKSGLDRICVELDMWRTKALDVEKHPVVVVLQAERDTANLKIAKLDEVLADALVDVKHLNQVNRTHWEENTRLTAELATANEVIRQIAQMFGIADVRHILGDLGRVQAGIGVMRGAMEKLKKIADSPWSYSKAYSSTPYDTGRTVGVVLAEQLHPVIDAALSHEAVAGEVERQKDDPIRKALEDLVLEVRSLLEAKSIGVKRYARMWPIVVAAREALKGGE